MEQRPNILVIMSDQHNAKVMGCAGDPVVRTPALDGLAARGTLFDQAYCAAPLCAPSRMTFLTSQYPSDIEVWTNGCRLGEQVPTFAHSLSLAGYDTVLCGRMHFTGADQRRGFGRRLVGDVSGAVGSVPEGGKFEGIIPPETAGQTHRSLSAVGPGRSAYIAYDDEVTRRACDVLLDQDEEKLQAPFCMVVGYLLPHSPYICPKDLFEEYMDRITVPEVPPGYEESLHPAVKKWRAYRGVDRITSEQARIARAAYYGLVTYMDQRIGEVLAALEASRFRDNTVVVYTSDHGDMAGEHGMWWKDSFYEGSVRVPMIWSGPGAGPRRIRANEKEHHPVSLLDVGPTLIDLAQGETLPQSRGVSLLSLLSTDKNERPRFERGPVFAETYTAGQRPARMIRSGPWKLNIYHGYSAPQLFNLETDPDEVRDLGQDPEYADVANELMNQVMDGWSGARVEHVVSTNEKRREMIRRWQREVGPGKAERWDIPTGVNVFPME